MFFPLCHTFLSENRYVQLDLILWFQPHCLFQLFVVHENKIMDNNVPIIGIRCGVFKYSNAQLKALLVAVMLIKAPVKVSTITAETDYLQKSNCKKIGCPHSCITRPQKEVGYDSTIISYKRINKYLGKHRRILHPPSHNIFHSSNLLSPNIRDTFP